VEPEVRAYLCQRLVYDEPATLIRLTIHVSQPLTPRAIAFCEATRGCHQVAGDLLVILLQRSPSLNHVLLTENPNSRTTPVVRPREAA
jgi:hypothetical protein